MVTLLPPLEEALIAIAGHEDYQSRPLRLRRGMEVGSYNSSSSCRLLIQISISLSRSSVVCPLTLYVLNGL